MTSFTHYILDGTKVVAQYQTSTSSVTPSNVIYFYYDESGSPTGIKYNGNVYYFQKNLQGDIIRILNSSGTIVATYTYDAWGNIIASTDTSGVSIGTKNPFRYRGYYYDTETGLYYLNSRYYDPQVGRFLNADGLVSTGQGLLGSNMFAYCLNNPVNMMDSTGDCPITIIIGSAIAGAFINSISYIITTKASGQEITPKGMLGALLVGFVSGGFGGCASAAFNTIWQIVFSLSAGGVNGVYTFCTTEGDYNTKFRAAKLSFGVTTTFSMFGAVAINVNDPSPLCSGFASYSAALFLGPLSEGVSVLLKTIDEKRQSLLDEIFDGFKEFIEKYKSQTQITGISSYDDILSERYDGVYDEYKYLLTT